MKKHTTNNILLFLFVSVLYGCGSEGNNTASNQEVDTASPNTETLYQAVDAIRTGPLSETFYLDLSNNISSNDGSEVSVIHVASMSSDSFCAPISVDDKGFTIDATSANVCEYRYSVGAKSTRSITPMAMAEPEESASTSTATARAAVGQTVTILAPLSSVTSEGIAIPIDVSNGGAIDTGVYTLSSDVTMPYGADSGSSAVASPSTNKITYTPGAGFLGVERISYSYSDGTNILTGDIDVSVSTSSNNAPTSGNFQYQDPVTGLSIIGNGEQVTVDVASYISDADSDVVTLTKVHAYDANTTISGSTTFEFSSTNAGTHHITYVVSDGNGGFSSGVIQITVEADSSLVRGWQNIVFYHGASAGDLTMTAPMSRVEAEYVNLPYSNILFGDGANSPAYSEITLHTYNQAMTVCQAKGGRLPTVEELTSLIGTGHQIYDVHNWPVDASYWSSESGSPTTATAVTATLSTPSSTELTLDQAQLVTCVDYDSPNARRYSVDNETLTAVGDKTRYRFRLLTPEQEPAAYAKNVNVHAALTQRGGFDLTSYEADASGFIEADYSDLSFEDNIAVVSVFDIVEESIITSTSSSYALDVSDPSKWNRAITEGTGLPSLDPALGLPITVAGKRLTSVYNDKSYLGESLIGRFETYQVYGKGGGRYSFYIEQESATPDPLTWGQDVYRPGGPNAKNFEIVIDIFTEEVKVYIDAMPGDDPQHSFTDIVLTGDRYVWFEVSNNQFLLYSTIEPIKPKSPLLSFDMDWGQINPNENYWIGFGGRSAGTAGMTVFTYAREAYFKSIAN